VAAFAVILSRRCQRLGDFAAHTIVIRHAYRGIGRAVALLALFVLPWPPSPARGRCEGQTGAFADTTTTPPRRVVHHLPGADDGH